MQDIQETSRRRTPFPKPQSIAFEGTALWIGSIETKKVYRLDSATLAVVSESGAPGKPWGMTSLSDGELRVICGETDDDDRYVRRFVPASGFVAGDGFRCPDDTGSQLSFDGRRLFISQWYRRRLVAVDRDGAVQEIIDVPHQICGQTIVDGDFFLVTTEDESTNDYWITRVSGGNGSRRIADLARIPFAARALAFDGKQFWTNHRDAGEVVTFSLP